MTTTLNGVAKKKAEEQLAEQQATVELVRMAREQGLSLTGPDGLLKQLTKTVLETSLNEEMTEHLGYETHDAEGSAGAGCAACGSYLYFTNTYLTLWLMRCRAHHLGGIVGFRRRRVAGVVASVALLLSVAGLPGTADAAVPHATVTSVSATTGSTNGGARITVHGTHFSHVYRVLFGSTAGTKVHVSSTHTLTITAPKHAAGRVDLRVQTRIRSASHYSTITSKDRFTYYAPPTVTSVSPAAGPTTGGTRVTVRGHGFLSVTRVKFSTSAGTSIKVLSSTSLLVTAPRRGMGTVNVSVIGRYGTSVATTHDHFTFGPTPSITRIRPTNGTTGGGTRVTVTGAGFTGATAVLFGTSRGASIKVSSSTTLTATAPAHTAGRVDVRVTTPYGTSPTATADHYIYIAPAPEWTTQQVSGGDEEDSDGGDLSSVACTDADHCIAVGLSRDDGDTYALLPLIQTDTNGTWVATALALPGSYTDANLAGVSCAASDTCVAVGSAWAGEDNHPLIETLQAGTWVPTVLSVPAGADGAYLSGVSCVAADACVAVGGAYVDDADGNMITGEPFVATYTGGPNWATELLPDPTGADNARLAGISCPVADTCIAVGDDQAGTSGTLHPLIETLNASDWTSLAPTTPGSGDSTLTGISCTATTSCIAVGTSSVPFALTLAGTGTWSATIVPTPSGQTNAWLNAISCTSATTCTAIGSSYAGDPYGGGIPLAETLATSGWSADNPPLPPIPDDGTFSDADGYGIACASATACVAVGTGNEDEDGGGAFAAVRH